MFLEHLASYLNPYVNFIIYAEIFTKFNVYKELSCH